MDNHPFQSPLNEIGFWIDTRLGNTKRYYLSPPEDVNMRVPDAVLKAVVFLGQMKTEEGNQDASHYGGTGFFVSLDSVNIVGKVFNYLITAKHVLYKIETKENAFILRVNTTDGKSTIINRGKGLKWYYHPTDEAVDVVALPVKYVPSIDCNFMPTSMFATDDVIQKENIGIGDEVFIAGLFPKHSGSQRNEPILRIGTIAMMPKERIMIQLRENEYRKAEVYLIEAKSLGGLSGCPVVVHKTTGFYLLGVMQGHWNTKLEKMDSMDADLAEAINMGIAIVTPATKILEVLNNPDLVKYRLELEEIVKKQDMPTPDNLLKRKQINRE